MKGICIVENCKKSGIVRRGLCNSHYQQARREGFPIGNTERPPVSDETKQKISYALKGKPGLSGEDHPMWKQKHSVETKNKMSIAKLGKKIGPVPTKYSDSPGYMAVHNWMRRHYPKSGFCETCKEERVTYWSNISGKYIRDRKDFWELCVPCHKIFDYILAIEAVDPSILEIMLNKRNTGNAQLKQVIL